MIYTDPSQQEGLNMPANILKCIEIAVNGAFFDAQMFFVYVAVLFFCLHKLRYEIKTVWTESGSRWL